MNDMLSFIYLASLFAVGGAAFSLMWRNISDIKNEQVRRYSARPHPEAPKEGEEILYIGTKAVEPSPDCISRYENALMKLKMKTMMEIS